MRGRLQAARLVALAAVLAVGIGMVVPGPSAADPAAVGGLVGRAVGAPTELVAPSSDDPIVIVMDTSGSMNDADPDSTDGATKLETAKAAIIGLLKEMDGAEVALVTYPAGAAGRTMPEIDDCPTGRWMIDLTPLDVASATAAVRSITADGETPTGPTLEAVGHRLIQTGITRATVILVTDGMENCGRGTCDVAKTFASLGLDLTVHAVGLSDDPDLKEQLDCVARATDGRSVTVRNLGVLQEELSASVHGSLFIEVDMPETAQPTSRQASEPPVGRVTVTAQAVGVANVVVSLSLTNLGSAPVAVSPAKRHLGNLAVDESVESTFTMYPGAVDVGPVRWRVVVTSDRPKDRLPFLPQTEELTGFIQVGSPGVSVQDAGKILRDAKNVVIMGDSYSSGENGGEYLPGSGDESWENRCHRSRNGYGSLLFPEATIIACSGAVTSDFFQYDERRDKLVPPQIQALRDLEEVPDLVILSVGGNDAMFSSVILYALTQGVSVLWDAPEWDVSLHLVAEIEKVLKAVDSVVNSPEWMAARDGKAAHILVMPYPNLLPTTTGGRKCLYGITSAEVDRIRDWESQLNERVSDAVARVPDRPIHFVDPVSTAFTTSICDDDPPASATNLPVSAAAWVSSQFGSSWKQEIYHPNARGYREMSNAVIEWSLVSADQDPQDFGPAPALASPIETRMSAVERVLVDMVGVESRWGLVEPGGELVIDCEEFPAETRGGLVDEVCDVVDGTSDFLILVQSDPQFIGYVHGDPTDRDGLTVRLPLDLASGTHTLIVQGLDQDGSVLEGRLEFEVSPPGTIRAIGLAMLAVILFVVSGVLFGIGAFRSRRAGLHRAIEAQ
ncbi:MAG: VWA domain-containing protein [Actinobacteria bacterium]|nr:VWA domain-containing protein [Actinomycetota bacterium]